VPTFCGMTAPPSGSDGYFAYLLRCRDGSLYCGIARSVERRLAEHNSGRGARYMVPARRPAECVWKRGGLLLGDALRLERWIKRLPVRDKRALADGSHTVRRVPVPGATAWRLVRRPGTTS